MKNKLLLALLLVFTSATFAQNVQLHYDFERGLVTSTVEMFKPDKYGSTFFFVDMDYSSDDRDVNNGLSLAYWEIARAFKWSENQKILPRAEFNGGILKLDGVGAPFIPIENCWLAGLEYTWASSDFSKIFTIQGNYKYIQNKHDASFQITGVWVVQLLKGKLTFTGFADFWKEDMDWNVDNVVDTEFRFLSEPQLWFNATKNFAVGGEVEISNNFTGSEFNVLPTLGAKWTF